MSDYSQVINLWKISGLEVGRSDTNEGIQQKLERDADLFLIAEEGDIIIGVIMGSYDGRRGWINHLAVMPNYRHTGIGSSLVGKVEGYLKAKGCLKINLFVKPYTSNVQEFYKLLGYNRADIIFMEKWIQ